MALHAGHVRLIEEAPRMSGRGRQRLRQRCNSIARTICGAIRADSTKTGSSAIGWCRSGIRPSVRDARCTSTIDVGHLADHQRSAPAVIFTAWPPRDEAFGSCSLTGRISAKDAQQLAIIRRLSRI
jgi:hypothetical protein